MGFHKSQIFFYLLVSFLAGIFIASISNISQYVIYVGLIVAIGLIGLFWYRKSFNRSLMLVGFLLVSFLFGVIRFNSVDLGRDRLDFFTDLKAGQRNVEVTINAYVDGEPVSKTGRQDIIFKAKELIIGGKKILIDDKILVTVRDYPKYNYGDIVSIEGVLQKPQNFSDFDYILYLKKDGVRTVMLYPKVSSYTDLKLGFSENLKVSLYKNVFRLKRNFEIAVSRSVPEPNASFINGILLGSRQNIPDNLKEAFSKTGTTHILAISGYNIMIISWVILSALVLFFKRRTAFWCSVVVIFLFTILTGASSSVVRASIMGLLLLFAQGYGRLYNPRNSIILAGGIMAYINPFVLTFDIGFQLSFAAVLGLMYLYPYIDYKLHKVSKLGILKEIILMTLSAQAAVAPLLIYYFKSFSLISLPANVLVVPLLPAAMLAGFTTGLAGIIFPVAGNIIGWFAWAITTYQIEVVKFLACGFSFCLNL